MENKDCALKCCLLLRSRMCLVFVCFLNWTCRLSVSAVLNKHVSNMKAHEAVVTPDLLQFLMRQGCIFSLLQLFQEVGLSYQNQETKVLLFIRLSKGPELVVAGLVWANERKRERRWSWKKGKYLEEWIRFWDDFVQIWAQTMEGLPSITESGECCPFPKTFTPKYHNKSSHFLLTSLENYLNLLVFRLF